MNQNKQQLARDLYLHTLKTQTEIADILDVSRRTIYQWMKKGRWEEMKIAARQAPHCLVQNLYNHIDALEQKIHSRPVEDRCPTKDEVEMLRKLTNMIHKSTEGHTSGHYIQSFEMLMDYLRKHKEHDLADKIFPVCERLIKGSTVDINWNSTQLSLSDMMDKLARLDKQDAELDRIMEPENSEPSSNVTRPDPHATSPAPHVTSPSPSERAGVRPWEANGKFWEDAENHNNITEPAPTQPHEEINDANKGPELPISDFTEDEQFAPDAYDGKGIDIHVLYYADLPPHKRPSPYRVDDTLWVNEIDDLDNTNSSENWGERKIGDTVRRYSEIKK